MTTKTKGSSPRSRKPRGGSRRRAPTGTRRKGFGPVDTEFFLSPRLRFTEVGISNPFTEHPWVYACTNAIAKNLRQVPFKIVQDEAAERTGLQRMLSRLRLARQGLWDRLIRRDHREVHTSPWANLIARPNPTQSWSAVMYATIVHLYNFVPPHRGGEAFWVKVGKNGKPVTSADEVPAEVYAYPGQWFTPIADKDSRALTGWKMNDPYRSEGLPFTNDQIVHFAFFDPENPLRGMSPFWPGQSAIRQDLKASSFNEAFFDNDADPGGVLMYPTGVEMNQDQIDDIRRRWEDRHRGANKKKRLAVLTEGAKYESGQVSHKEMDFIEQLKWDRSVCLAVSGVPEAELSIYENLIESNAISQDRGFWTKTLIPLGRLLEETLATQLFSGPETGIYDFATVKALQQLLGEMLAPAESLFRLGWGQNDINERLDLSMPNLAYGNVGYTNAGVVPYTDIAFVPPRPGSNGTHPALPDLDGEGEVPAAGGENEAPVLPTLMLRAVDKGAIWRRLEGRVLRESEKRFSSRFKRWAFDLRKDQLRRVDQVDQGKSLVKALDPADVDLVLFDLDQWRGIMTTVLNDAYVQAMRATLDDLRDEFAGAQTIQVEDPALQDALERKLERLQETVPVTIREQMRGQILQSIEAGESTEGLKSRLRAFFNFVVSPGRLLSVARTEIASIVNGTRNAVMEEVGVKAAGWVTAGDERVRDDHVTLGGSPPQPLGFNWMELLGKGGVLHYPGDPSGPADQLINCYLPGTVVSGRFVAGSKARYAGPSWEIKTARGRWLRVTPNHPVLTNEGWVAAHQLRKGDHLFSDALDLHRRPERHIDHENGPVLIEDVFDALSANAARRSTMVSALDFHGDARFMEGEVDIVGANGQLEIAVESSPAKGRRDLGNVLTDAIYPSAPARGPLGTLSLTGLSAGGRAPSTLALPDHGGTVLLERGPLQPLCLGLAAQWHTVLGKPSRESEASHTAFIRELVDRSAGEIASDEIVEIRQIHFAGHVYDLQAEDGWMLAQSIVSSNCRCILVEE